MKINHNVAFDLSRRNVRHTVPFSKGDRGTHKIIFSFSNGHETVDISSATIATVAVRNGVEFNGGKGVIDEAEIDAETNQIYYTPSDAALLVEGNIVCVLTLTDANGQVLYAPYFFMYVDDNFSQNLEAEIDEALRKSTAWELIAKAELNAAIVAKYALEAQNCAKSATNAANSATSAANSQMSSAASADSAEQSATSAAESSEEAKEWAEKAEENANHITTCLEKLTSISEEVETLINDILNEQETILYGPPDIFIEPEETD